MGKPNPKTESFIHSSVYYSLFFSLIFAVKNGEIMGQSICTCASG